MGKLWHREKDSSRVYDSQAKNTALTKIAITIIAIVLSIVILIVCVYVIIPSIISNASDRMDENFALQMYESTLVTPPPAESAEPVFIQPDQEDLWVPVPRECFATALSENSDIVGRINIKNLGINYLVAQADDNEYYLKTGYDGNESHNGAIFLDYRCDIDTETLNGHYILYGHNMKNGSMFHNLMEYKDRNVFYDNRVIRFDTLYEDYRWEIFSVYVTGTDFYYIDTDFNNDGEWLSFLNKIQQKSMFPTDVVLSPDDVVLTLSTCSYEFDDARFVVHARLIK